MTEWVCPRCGHTDPDEGESLRQCVKHWPPVRMTKREASVLAGMPGGLAHARTTDPSTSHAAAASVTGLRENQRAVLGMLEMMGEGTDEALVEAYERAQGLPKQSPSGIRTRRSELAAMDPPLVIDTGRKAKLKSNRNAIVWRPA